MTTSILTSIHKAFTDFSFRAETPNDELIRNTFVDTEPLISLLSNSHNHQIIYGRRGTGKTHIFRYLSELSKNTGDFPIYIDMRTVGSNSSIYNDRSRPLADRAAQIINDVLQSMLSNFYQAAVEVIGVISDSKQVTIRLDDFTNAISKVKITGTTENETEQQISENVATTIATSACIAQPSLSADASSSQDKSFSKRQRTNRSGSEHLHLDFNSIHSALDGLIRILGLKKVWLFIDEWSEIPTDLQPYLADLIKRTILPSRACVVKIAAIEHKSNFSIPNTDTDYIGFELGADISANIHLDDFLVFNGDRVDRKALDFFEKLLFQHYKASKYALADITNSKKLIQTAFTQYNVFSEFVRAAEGVPRDALNIAALLAQQNYAEPINMQSVRSAARKWYTLDKSASLKSNHAMNKVMHLIIAEVIGTRKSRAFLFPNDTDSATLDYLFHSRLLHILKKNVSSNDEPGRRYDVYKIDYGCYVELINTNNEPSLLFAADLAEDTPLDEVPKDDYRSIRRAILTPDHIKEYEVL